MYFNQYTKEASKARLCLQKMWQHGTAHYLHLDEHNSSSEFAKANGLLFNQLT